MHLPPNLSKTIKGRVINWYQIFFLSQFHPSVQYKNHIIRSVIILADVFHINNGRRSLQFMFYT